MKYFTPERYLRLGDLSDREKFLAAHEDWEAAITAYRERFARIRDLLPHPLRDLIEGVYLHDATVVDMWEQGEGVFTITLHPESSPSRLVVLAYSLVEPAHIDRKALPEQVHAEPVAWLYDELDIEGSPVDTQQPNLFVTHRILLSNGWEVTLRFDSVRVERPVGLIPLCVTQAFTTS